jgi:hypothetical protein
MKAFINFALMFFIIANTNTGYSQHSDYISLADTNKVWNVFENMIWWGETYSYIIQKCDEEGKGQYYSVLKSQNGVVIENSGYIREDTIQKKVYFLENEEEYIIYDFNLEVGDAFSTYGWEVENIDSILLDDGQYRKRWIFWQDNFWIEGIGSSLGLIHQDWAFKKHIPEATLICYYELDSLIYFNSNYDSCYYGFVDSVEDPNINDIISVYPNPAKDLLHVKIDVPQLEEKTKVIFIHDISGTGMINEKFTKNEHTVSLKNFPAGIYTAFIMCEGHILKTEKIVVVK